jgi:hypothetical protein
MKVFRMAVALALLAGPAYAQGMPTVNWLQDKPSKTDEERAQDAERERVYKDSLKKIPDAKASNDPWGGMRNDPPKPAAAPKASAAAKKPKTPTAN